MTPDRTAREEAERIATGCVGPLRFIDGRSNVTVAALIDEIESALLAYGRREGNIQLAVPTHKPYDGACR